jgi:hypothetical protein
VTPRGKREAPRACVARSGATRSTVVPHPVLADLSTPRRVFAEINNEQRVPLDEQRLHLSQTRGALA